MFLWDPPKMELSFCKGDRVQKVILPGGHSKSRVYFQQKGHRRTD